MKIQTTRVYSEVSDAVKRGCRTISAQGSSRSSKTYNIVLFLCLYLLEHANTRLSVVRKSLPAIRGSVLYDFKDILVRLGIWADANFNKSEMIYTFPNGSFVEFFSTDQEQKLRGRKRDILFVNEANELSFVEWQQLAMRTAQFKILDYNPSFSEDHWINKLNEESGVYHFITTYRDNPFLEQTIIDEIESLQTKSTTLWQIYGLGKRAIVEGIVFPRIEQVAEFPDWCKSEFIGIDFGYTNDPTAIVKVGYAVNADDEECLFIDEICYRTRMTTGDICDALRPYRNMTIDAESADPRLIDEIHKSGARIYPVKKGTGSIEAGIARMQTFRIFVTARSLNVLKEFRNYTYAQDKEGRWLNIPIDAYNHAIDAVRYVVMSELMSAPRGKFRLTII